MSFRPGSSPPLSLSSLFLDVPDAEPCDVFLRLDDSGFLLLLEAATFFLLPSFPESESLSELELLELELEEDDDELEDEESESESLSEELELELESELELSSETFS